jgi:hypothetical protein
MGYQEEAEADSGDGQDGADGPACRAHPAPGLHTGPQTDLVPGLEGGRFLGVAHHPRELPLEVVHQRPLIPLSR